MSFARKTLAPSLLVLACALAAPAAHAGFGIGGSIGTGFTVDPSERVPTNIEIMPTYKIAILNLDLGIKFNLEETKAGLYDFQFRPGVRVGLPFIYGRFAVPLRVNNGGDYGLLFGAGTTIGIGPVALFLEADVNMSKELTFSNPGIEFRLGVQFGF